MTTSGGPFFDNDEDAQQAAAELDQASLPSGEDASTEESAVGEAEGAPTTPAQPPASGVQPGVGQAPWGAQPPVDEMTRRRLQELERIEQEYQRKQQQEMVQNYIQQFERELDAMGLVPEQITQLVRRERQRVEQIQQREQQWRSYAEYTIGKERAAQVIGQRYGVPAESLMQYDSPEAMDAAARTQQELQNLKSEVTNLKRGQVTSQQFDSNRSSPQLGGSRRARLLDKGQRGELTREEARELGFI